MADIDNIPLELEEVPELSSYDAGLLWNPEGGADNEEWQQAIRSLLSQSEDYYEQQFDSVVDALLRTRRQTILLQAFVRMLTDDAFSGTLTVERLGVIISEYMKVDGAAPIMVTEGYKKWAEAKGEKTDPYAHLFAGLPTIATYIAYVDETEVGRHENVPIKWSVLGDTITIDFVSETGSLEFGEAPHDAKHLSIKIIDPNDGKPLAAHVVPYEIAKGDPIHMVGGRSTKDYNLN